MKVATLVMAGAIALGASGAFAVEMTDDERAYLRERAQALQAERERKPDWDGGTRRVDEAPPAAGKAAAPRAQKRSAQKRSAQKKPVKTRIKRAVKDLPGALVRNR